MKTNKVETELLPAQEPAQKMAVAQHIPQPLATRDPVDLLEIVARAAMSPDVDPSKMREILAMRKELQAEKAKAEFDSAFAAFQAECPVIQKLKGVEVSGRRMYAYAPLEDIVTVIKPICEKHGFSFTFDTDVASEAGWVIAYCDITHKGGHQIRKQAKFPLGGKTNLMSDTQQYSAALTFASRRVLGQAFGLVFAGEDLDGRLGKLKSGKPDQDETRTLAGELWALLKPVRGTEKNWDKANQWMWDEMVLVPEKAAPDLTADEFRAAIDKAKGKVPR